MLHRALLVLSLHCVLLASPAVAPTRAHAQDMSRYWANVAMIDERYCGPIATMSARVVAACACTPEDITREFLSVHELRASCTYHLIRRIPEDRVMQVNEQALTRCMSLLDVALRSCTQTRLPEACELDRIFTPSPGALALSRPAGSACRAANGDEGFNAQFLCAEGLMCADTCVPRVASAGVCRNPLGIPPAIP